jgi:hypothetical protein
MERNVNRRINGFTLPAEEYRGGEHRWETIFDHTGKELGTISSWGRSDQVRVNVEGMSKGKTFFTGVTLTKDQAFSAGRVFIVGNTLGDNK